MSKRTKIRIRSINSNLSDIDKITIKAVKDEPATNVQMSINEVIHILSNPDEYSAKETPANDQKKKSIGRYTINDAYKFIDINEYVNDATNHPQTLTEVVITYVKELVGTNEKVDVAIFTCANMNDLHHYWKSYMEENDLCDDCICSFSVCLTESDRRYVSSIRQSIIDTLPKFVNWESDTGFDTEDRQLNESIVSDILDMMCHNTTGQMIYPHVSARYDAAIGNYIYGVKRYWGE